MSKIFPCIGLFMFLNAGLEFIQAQDFQLVSINSKDNILYAGVDNFLKIEPKTSATYIKCTNGIAYISDSLINVIPRRSGRASIEVYQIIKDQSDTILLVTQHMIVSSLPPAKLMIGNKLVQELKWLDREYLKENNEFKIHLNQDIIESRNWMDVEQIIIGYTRGGYYLKLESEGNKISDEVMNQLLEMRPGQEISLQVRVKCEGEIRKTIPVHRARLN